MAAAAHASVTGVGAVTSIGRDAWTSAASARAGLCGFREHAYMIDTAGEPMRVARVPWLDASVPVPERCVQMLLPALDEALATASPTVKRIGLALGLPPPRPGRGDDLAGRVKQAVAEHFGGRIAPVVTSRPGTPRRCSRSTRR